MDAQPSGHAARFARCIACRHNWSIDASDWGPRMACPACGVPAVADQFFGHYQTIRRVGSGGMGTTHEAIDSLTGRTACLKLLGNDRFADLASAFDFAREARIVASISHPNIVQVYEFGRKENTFYLAMEFLEHGSLESRMSAGAIAEGDLLGIALDVARGLDAAAANGLLHRDVKPGNILFDPAGRAKLVDFGLSLPVDEARRQQGLVWGSPYYIAPERLDGQPEDFRADIYSLGATMFHAAAKRPLFKASSASLMAWKHLKAQKVAVRTFAPHLQEQTSWIIDRCVQRNPADRFSSYSELIAALQSARKHVAGVPADQKSTHRLEIGVPDPASSARLRWLSVAAAAAVAAAGIAWITLLQSDRADVLRLDDPAPVAAALKAPGGSPDLDPGTDIGSGWRSFQIGLPAHAGGTLSAGADRVSLWHEGRDVWGTADSCGFAYKTASGDLEMILRVAEIRGGHEQWKKSGIMVRATLDPGSPNAFLMVAPQSGTRLQRRHDPGAETTPNYKSDLSERRQPPVWLKLVRSGDTITAYDCLTGASGPWRQCDQIRIALPEQVYVGPALCAHGTEFHCEADFDDIRLSN